MVDELRESRIRIMASTQSTISQSLARQSPERGRFLLQFDERLLRVPLCNQNLAERKVIVGFFED